MIHVVFHVCPKCIYVHKRLGLLALKPFTHAFVENVADTKLRMAMPPPKDIELVSP